MENIDFLDGLCNIHYVLLDPVSAKVHVANIIGIIGEIGIIGKIGEIGIVGKIGIIRRIGITGKIGMFGELEKLEIGICMILDMYEMIWL